jgi:hypothetical protein
MIVTSELLCGNVNPLPKDNTVKSYRKSRNTDKHISDQDTSHWTSRDSSVGIALGYGLDDRSSRVQFLAGAGKFTLHHRVQNGSGAHPASYPIATRGSFPGGKAADV